MIQAPHSTKDARQLGLPSQLWSIVSTYLKPEEFNHFIRACKLFLVSGTQSFSAAPQQENAPVPASIPVRDSMITALYQRLRKVDSSLPAHFITNDTLGEYLAALLKVSKDQEKEIRYLRKHHPDLVQLHYDNAQPNLALLRPLAKLETIHVILDRINSIIITTAETFGKERLNLNKSGITRFPGSLLTAPQYARYFSRLKELNCNNNNIRVISLRNLASLEIFDIEHSGLWFLEMNNLPALAHFDVKDNHLHGSLDLTSFPQLVGITVHNNKLRNLLVKGLQLLRYLDCSNNHLVKLTVDSPMIEDLNCSWNQLKKLKVAHLDNLALPTEDNDISGIQLYTNRLKPIPQNLVEKFGEQWEQVAIEDQMGTEELESDTADDSDTLKNKWLTVCWARARASVCPHMIIAQGPLLEAEDTAVALQAQANIQQAQNASELLDNISYDQFKEDNETVSSASEQDGDDNNESLSEDLEENAEDAAVEQNHSTKRKPT